ncbi:hypothetical protein [Sphingobium sp. CAP-1]|uniref:hypothetical protein n=1 Tax=Sphingobium sp. CAP-1 TaxID=2676077 RepID=UPI0012BB2B36|nr:hypothetical protein [Sphingobium sp. CAP-1]QGP77894.1 hypothetical protein GL174_01935 [Sphingobium sp. CAP-1]
MFLTIASQTLAVLAAAMSPVHSTEISHGAQAYSASYHAQPSISLRQVEPRFANRNAVPVCRWQADVTVNRAVVAQGRAVPAFGKAIHRFAPLSGSYAGSCAAARSQIDAQVARYTQSRAAEAVAVAEQDRAVLVNELDGVRALTVQG